MSESVKNWLDAAGRFPLMSKAEFSEAIKQRDLYEPGSKQYIRIVNKICERNLRLIHRVANRYTLTRNMPHLRDFQADMLQLGYFGLRRAVEKYDITRGYTFSTYALPWIKQSITRGITRLENTVYIPENMHTEVMYIRRHGKRSTSKNGTIGEHYLNCATRALNVDSVDRFAKDEDGSSILDLLSDENKIVGRDSDVSSRRQQIKNLLIAAKINDRDIDVVMKYLTYGRTEGARQSNLSVNHCREICNKAIDKVKAFVA